MHFISLDIPDVLHIQHQHQHQHQRHEDERGCFMEMELFRYQDFTQQCGDLCFVQDNLSRSW